MQRVAQPGPRVDPVAVGRGDGNVDNRGRLFQAHPREIAQLDQLRLEAVFLGQAAQGLVKIEYLVGYGIECRRIDVDIQPDRAAAAIKCPWLPQRAAMSPANRTYTS